jgi:Lon-like protease
LRYRKLLLRLAVIVVVLVALGFYIRIDYFVLRPSRAVDLRGLITVENADQDDRGSFYLVTVNQQRANLITAAVGYLHPQMELNPMERVIPAGMDETDYRLLLVENMTESQHLAQVVALRRAGYDVDIVSDGVEVIGFLDDAPAEGFLETGDKIIFVDDNPVFLATEVPLLVQDREVGKEVDLTVVRNERQVTVTVITGPHPEDELMPFLGIFIQTLPWEPIIPVNISMDTGRIGGPSAGLMFVLEIMNQLQPGDLTSGRIIAGTGTIDLNENVGRVGGVRQKVIAAENAGADYFFVPEGNYEQAMAVGVRVEIVPVANLEEALNFLAALE